MCCIVFHQRYIYIPPRRKARKLRVVRGAETLKKEFFAEVEQKGELMTCVTKSEREALRCRFPDLEIVRTVHKYYVVEKPAVMRYLRRLRNGTA